MKKGRTRKGGFVGKRQLKVWISEDVYELLHDMAPLLYGEPYGSISYVVEQALRAYLASAAHAQKHAKTPGKIKKYWGMVLDCIRITAGGMIPEEVPAKILNMCIANVRGGDPRTIEKWTRLFREAGLISDRTPHLPPHRKIYRLAL